LKLLLLQLLRLLLILLLPLLLTLLLLLQQSNHPKREKLRVPIYRNSFLFLASMNIPSGLNQIFEKHLPQPAIPYCLQLWQETPFSLHIKNPRNTKLGDFRYRKDRKIQTITLNVDLNPYQFLLTYIHEIAHLRIFEKLGPNHLPHGSEWKRMFQDLMEPLFLEKIFPNDIFIPLRLHMKNPPASSSRDLFLMKEMDKYNVKNQDEGQIFLSDLKPGNSFLLEGRKFTKRETRRTRILCEELGSGKKFLVSSLAKVKPLD
jgi:hypothetical protein